MSLIAELKRRKVLKVGAAYLVVAWVVVQVAGLAFPAFDAPPWVLRVTVADGAALNLVDHFVVPLMKRGDRTLALLVLDMNDLHPDLRAAVIAGIETPGTSNPRAAELIARHFASATSLEAKTVTPSRLYLWLGDFDGVARSDDSAVNQIIAWERDPPAFRNSPQMKAKLADTGVVAYWRAHGFPPQCTPRGDDFHCD